MKTTQMSGGKTSTNVFRTFPDGYSTWSGKSFFPDRQQTGTVPGMQSGFMSCSELAILMHIHLVNVCMCG